MKTLEKFVLDQKREQFRVKIRNDDMNVKLNQKRKMMIQRSIEVDNDGPISQIRNFIRHGGPDFEQRVQQILISNDMELIMQGSDYDTLMILCNICAATSEDNIKLIHKLQIPHRLLAVGKTSSLPHKCLLTCIWGLTSFMASVNQDVLLGDLNQLILDGLIEFVLSVHERTPTDISMSSKISELLYNLLYSLQRQQVVEQSLILSQQKKSEIFTEVLKDLEFYQQSEDFFSLQIIYFILDEQPQLFNNTTQKDIVNLLNILDSKKIPHVYHTLRLLGLISSEVDETHIQRLIFMTMIDDVYKHIHHENMQIRNLCYKILSNLSFSSTESILENMGRIQIFREVVLNFHHCNHPESGIEIMQLLGNMVTNCLEYIGKETVQDSGLCQILQDKLHDYTTENSEYIELLLKLIFAHVELKIGTYDSRLRNKVEQLLYHKNQQIADISDILLSYII